MLTPAEIKSLNDKELDAEYAHAFDTKQIFYVPLLEYEIIDRLQGIGGFVAGLFGSTRFPLYNARGHFIESDAAQSSVKTNVGNVGAGLSSFAGNLGVGIFKGIWPIVLLLAIVGVIIFMIKFKKG